MLSIKIDDRMKRALEQIAEKEFAPVSSIVRKALDRYIREQGIHWQEEPEEKPKKKPTKK